MADSDNFSVQGDEDVTRHLTNSDWKVILKEYDSSGDGNITDSEIQRLLDDYANDRIKNPKIAELVALFDVDGDKKIDMEEFMQFKRMYTAIDETKKATDHENKIDDGVSTLTADEYVKIRIHPILANYQSKTPGLAFFNNSIIAIVMLLSVCSSVFSSFNLVTFIPMALAMVHALTSWNSYKQVDERLNQTNSAVQQLNNLLIWWDSLNMIEKRVITNKERLVETTENIIQARFVNYSAAKANSRNDDKSEEQS